MKPREHRPFNPCVLSSTSLNNRNSLLFCITTGRTFRARRFKVMPSSQLPLRRAYWGWQAITKPDDLTCQLLDKIRPGPAVALRGNLSPQVRTRVNHEGLRREPRSRLHDQRVPMISGTTARSSYSSSVKRRDAAAMFCSKCSTEEVPGIGRITGDRHSSQESATWVGAA